MKNISVESGLSDSELSDSPEGSEISHAGTPSPELLSDDAASPSFDFDLERKKQADFLLNKLTELTRSTLETEQKTPEENISKQIQIRNACIANIEQCRKSAYFQTLANKINMHERLVDSEYMLYALITDNVNTLDLELLRMIQGSCDNAFNSHINILIAVREWQTAAGMYEKRVARSKLRDALNIRNFDLYLNLSGVNLAGANLKNIDFRFTNLENADLSHSEMGDTGLNFCNLNRANLSYINHPYTQGPTIAPVIVGSTAKNACLDGVSFRSPHWQDSDFSGSSCRNAQILRGNFKNCYFDRVDFDDSTIKIEFLSKKSFVSFKDANLVTAQLAASDYKTIELTEANLLRLDETFESGLDTLYKKNLRIIFSPGRKDDELPEKISHRQNIIAENIVNKLAQSSLNHEEKGDYLEIALGHDMFQPQSTLEQLANQAERVIHKLDEAIFGESEHRDIYKSKAIKILEAASDQLPARAPQRQAMVNAS